MIYKCKENDCLIEMGKDKSEILISAVGETVKTVIGIKDLNKALSMFTENETKTCYKTKEPCKYDCDGLCKESV